jgi:hypothetical protein
VIYTPGYETRGSRPSPPTTTPSRRSHPAGTETDEPVLPLHELCLFRLGIHLGELCWLSELAEHLRRVGRSRVLLTAPPLRLPGATGSPLTPIATT